MDELLREVLQLQGLEMQLMPPSFYELAQHNGLPVEESLLEQRLIYGNYPSVVSNLEKAKTKLRELVDIEFELLKLVKIERDRQNKGLNDRFSMLMTSSTGKVYRITVMGRPDQSATMTTMIGVRNTTKDGQNKSFCVWVMSCWRASITSACSVACTRASRLLSVSAT